MNESNPPVHPYRVPGEGLTPREWIMDNIDKELPVQGGWGYGEDDLCIIDKNDPIVDSEAPFDGIEIEYEFLEQRLKIEYYLAHRDEHPGVTGFSWNFLQQETMAKDDRQIDHLMFETVVEKPDGDIKYLSHFWFDITSFFGHYDIEDFL